MWGRLERFLQFCFRFAGHELSELKKNRKKKNIERVKEKRYWH